MHAHLFIRLRHCPRYVRRATPRSYINMISSLALLSILGTFAASYASDTLFTVDPNHWESSQSLGGLHGLNVPIVDIQSPRGNDTDLEGMETLILNVGLVPALVAGPDTTDSLIGRLYTMFPGLDTVYKPGDSSPTSCDGFTASAPLSKLSICLQPYLNYITLQKLEALGLLTANSWMILTLWQSRKWTLLLTHLLNQKSKFRSRESTPM